MNFTRRNFLAGLAGTATAGMVHGAGPEAFRFAHLTDMHCMAERLAAEGFAASLKAVEKLRPRPDFILTGGDLVNDVLDTDTATGKKDFERFLTVLRDHTDLPVYHGIGNHDVFGWQRSEEAIRRDPLYGKRMVLDALEMERTYYRFDHKGWRFFVLDDIQYTDRNRGHYEAYLDDEQKAWLKAELEATPAAMPKMVMSHIPILTVTVYQPAFQKDDAFQIGSNVMCRDAVELTDLLARHGVKLALSGHIHQLDRVGFRGVTYICDGAVCGQWWRGPHRGIEEGFGVLDLKADGSFTHRYHDYGWVAQEGSNRG